MPRFRRAASRLRGNHPRSGRRVGAGSTSTNDPERCALSNEASGSGCANSTSARTRSLALTAGAGAALRPTRRRTSAPASRHSPPAIQSRRNRHHARGQPACAVPHHVATANGERRGIQPREGRVDLLAGGVGVLRACNDPVAACHINLAIQSELQRLRPALAGSRRGRCEWPLPVPPRRSGRRESRHRPASAASATSPVTQRTWSSLSSRVTHCTAMLRLAASVPIVQCKRFKVRQ